MYAGRGTVGPKAEVVDREETSEAYDVNRSEDKVTVGSNSVLLMGKQMHDSPSSTLSRTHIFQVVDTSEEVKEGSDEEDLAWTTWFCQMITDEQNELIESAAELLYGLIHARYILTDEGFLCMLNKYNKSEFGRCPRVSCSGQSCLPIGLSHVPGASTVKMYCPKCEDVYHPPSKFRGSNIDGAYFGTSFPHLFLMYYPHKMPNKMSLESYVPRLFGFKLHKP